MKKTKKGSIWIITGLLLILAALILTGYNILIQIEAGEASQNVMDKIAVLKEDSSEGEQDALPVYVENPNMEMPVTNIDGYDYIGQLEIPMLGLSLPIMSEWNYTRLKIAPCRYTGSAYQDNLVICAHNYKNHFGRIKRLSVGATVILTDMDGNLFTYKVIEIETLPPTSIEEMKTGDWDLTLFTCTLGGQSRVTVRCNRVK